MAGPGSNGCRNRGWKAIEKPGYLLIEQVAGRRDTGATIRGRGGPNDDLFAALPSQCEMHRTLLLGKRGVDAISPGEKHFRFTNHVCGRQCRGLFLQGAA